MPELTAAGLVSIRTRPIGRDFDVYVYQPASVAVLTIGGSPTTGARTLTTSTDSGDPTDGIAGMTCRVTDSGGNPKIKPSKVRFKSWAANTLVVAENAIEWAAGDKVYIVRFWEVWARVPYFDPVTGEQFKDRTIAWSSDADAQRPKANAGPDAVADLSGGFVDVVFKSYLSWSSTLAPLPVMLPFLIGTDSAAGPGWSFECPTGAPPTGGIVWADLGGSPTVVGGGVNSSTVTYRYTTAGYYYTSFTVTDGNGKTGVRYVKVIIDDGTLAQAYNVPGNRGSSGRGWSMSRDVLSIAAAADNANWYDGAAILLVADDADTAERAFSGNRKNLRFSGWLKEDTTQRSAYGRSVSFRAVSTADILANIPAFPTSFRSDAAPADWYEFSQLSIDSVVYLLLRWHSTADIVTDYFPMAETAWTARVRPGENTKGQDLLSQINFVLRAARAELRCDRQGTLRAVRDEWFLSAAERAARETVMTLTLADIQSVSYGPSPHQAKVREVRLDGVNGSDPFLSGSPGSSPLDGGKPMEDKNLAPVSQAELNQWSGQQLAIENWQVPITVKMAGEYDVFDPAYGEMLDGTLSSFDPRIPDGPYSIQSVSFDDDSEKGVTISTLRLLASPGQYEAEARPMPASPPAAPSPPVIPDLPPVASDEPVGTGEKCGVAGEGGFFYSTNARTGSPPAWAAYNTGLSDATFIRSICSDPRRSTYAACIDDSGGVFTTTDWAGGAAWSSALTAAAAKVLIELADAATTTDPWLVSVNCFARSTDEIGVLVVVAQYTTAAGGATRVLFSTDWSSWTVGGEIPGYDYLGTVYKSWTIKQKDNGGSPESHAGEGELTFDGLNIILAAESMRDSSLATSAFQWSDDMGATWQAAAEEGESGSGGEGTSGPMAARVLSTGTLIMAWWRLTATGTDDHIIASTDDLSTISTVASLTGNTTTNEYASERGMLDILADDARAELFVDGTDTKIYIGGVLSDTISGDECRTVQGFSEDEEFILVGRSWHSSEKAGAADENVLYRSTDKGDNFADASGNLYALGARSVAGIVFDKVTDL